MASVGHTTTSTDATATSSPPSRADELDTLLSAVQPLIHAYITSASASASTETHPSGGHGLGTTGTGPRTTLLERHPPSKLRSLLLLDTPIPRATGGGPAALTAFLAKLFRYSVNTWDQGFLDKLYAGTDAVGVVSELVLAALNTNVHVYRVSPALTVVEKETGRALARVLLGWRGHWAGGVGQPGGSAANGTSLVVARHAAFPEAKTEGLPGRRLVVFTSAHGHYSLEKAAQLYGFGSRAVRAVPVDGRGRMRVDELARSVGEARASGEVPFYVNATAGTTVLGSYDPLEDIAEVCEREGLWLHVDGSWGGPVAFSKKHRAERLRGIERADSMAFTPHKMMGVPITCSFLLVKDMRVLHEAMTLPAGYLFHGAEEEDDGATVDGTEGFDGDAKAGEEEDKAEEVWDLGDLTPQCGRKGDSLKLALGWIYHGTDGYERLIDQAFEVAAYAAAAVANDRAFTLVNENPPPCLQICFYYDKRDGAKERNSRVTETVAKKLVSRGFMIDYAPGDEGKFFRVVVNGRTLRGTIEGLLKAIVDVGKDLDM